MPEDTTIGNVTQQEDLAERTTTLLNRVAKDLPEPVTLPPFPKSTEMSFENAMRGMLDFQEIQSKRLEQLIELVRDQFNRMNAVLTQMYHTMELMRLVIANQDEVVLQLNAAVDHLGATTLATAKVLATLQTMVQAAGGNTGVEG